MVRRFIYISVLNNNNIVIFILLHLNIRLANKFILQLVKSVLFLYVLIFEYE